VATLALTIPVAGLLLGASERPLLHYAYLQACHANTLGKQLVNVIDTAIKGFKGDSRRLSNAIGYLMMGRVMGWKVMLLIHDRKSVKDYEKILQINSKELFPEFGRMADKSFAYRALKKVTNFWKAVKGETPGVRSTEIL
jgi:hypothetical protein